MSNFTSVVNLSTGSVQEIFMPPKQAVVTAYERSKGNKDVSLLYQEKPASHPNYYEGRLTVACGDFAALKENNSNEGS